MGTVTDVNTYWVFRISTKFLISWNAEELWWLYNVIADCVSGIDSSDVWYHARKSIFVCIQDGIAAAKRAMRHMPLGCDRSHDRYWFFPAAAPGLYIEKGLLLVLAITLLCRHINCFFVNCFWFIETIGWASRAPVLYKCASTIPKGCRWNNIPSVWW